MYKLFIRTETEDIYLGSFPTLESCERATEIKLDIMNKMDGTEKARFYCLDKNDVRVACWIVGIERDS